MIPVLMSPKLNVVEAWNELFTNGVGPLDTLEAIVSEELNGAYTAEITIPTEQRLFEYIKPGAFVKLGIANDKIELFRIERVRLSINKTALLYLTHITYLMSDVYIRPFEQVTGAGAAAAAINRNKMSNSPFQIITDIDQSSYFENIAPVSMREIIGGIEESFITRFGAEVRWTGLEARMLARRGADTGYIIEYGKNLIDFQQEENIDNMYDSIQCFAKYDEQYYYSDTHNLRVVDYPRYLLFDASGEFSEEYQPTTARLNSEVNKYIVDHDMFSPEISIDLNFVHLPDTDQFENLLQEKIGLGDTVTVRFIQLGVDVQSRVIATTWDVINERYLDIKLGTPRPTIEQAIAQSMRR